MKRTSSLVVSCQNNRLCILRGYYEEQEVVRRGFETRRQSANISLSLLKIKCRWHQYGTNQIYALKLL